MKVIIVKELNSLSTKAYFFISYISFLYLTHKVWQIT